MKSVSAAFALLFFLSSIANGQGTILWNEGINGPLANLPGSAFSVGTLGVGTNSLMGVAQTVPNDVGGWTVYDDYFRITIPAGLEVTAVHYTVDRASWAWIGDAAFGNQYGFAINPVNGDLLPQWGLGFLSPGVYGLYVSDYDTQPFPTAATYRLDFVVVPEPSTLALAAVGAAGILGLRLRLGQFWPAGRRGRL